MDLIPKIASFWYEVLILHQFQKILKFNGRSRDFDWSKLAQSYFNVNENFFEKTS